MRLKVAPSVLVLVLAATPALGQVATEVTVQNNVFDPGVIEVAPGDTVSWRVLEGNHTVTEDTGLFDSGSLQAGETTQFTAPMGDSWLFYHCRIHGVRADGSKRGRGMVGVIKVGDPPPLPTGFEVRRVPTAEWPSLDGALADLSPNVRYRLDLAPGTYESSEGWDLTAAALLGGSRGERFPGFELTIRGTGDSPGDVVLQSSASSVLSASLDGIFLEKLTIRGGSFAAVSWEGVHRFGAQHVDVEPLGLYGVRAEGTRFGRLRELHVAGASVAGISIERCVDCDIHVHDVTVEESLAGLSAANAGGVVVEGSLFRDNGVGIAVKTTACEAAPQRGSHVFGNTFVNNLNRTFEAPAVHQVRELPPRCTARHVPLAALDLPVGAGVWIAGGSFNVVEDNTISGHSFGVVITGPAYGNRVVGNTVSESIEHDLAWDGTGANVCFADNRSPGGAEPSSMPPAAQTLYDCALPMTLGIPMPTVAADVLAWGLGLRETPPAEIAETGL